MLIDLWFVNRSVDRSVVCQEVLLLSLICMLIDLWFVHEVLLL